MNLSTKDQSIIDQWKAEPAPLLGALHAFHDRDGHLSEDVIKAISSGLKIPLAELYGTITFYHHFSQQAPGQAAPRVCTGPVCCLRGSDQALSKLKERGGTPMAMAMGANCCGITAGCR